MEYNLERLQEAERYLNAIQRTTQTTIEHLKSKETDHVFHTLGMLSEGLEWLLTIFNLTEETQVEKIDTSDIAETIETLVEGMENKDWMLISDCLEYDLLDKVYNWKAAIRVTLDTYHIASLEEE